MALSRDKILKHNGSFALTPVHVPAWADESGDDVVLVRGMTIKEFEINQSRTEDGLATATVLSRCIVDETGGALFKKEDIQYIAELPVAQVKLLSEAVARLSGLDPDEPDPEKAADQAVADAEGNSEATPSDSSSSD